MTKTERIARLTRLGKLGFLQISKARNLYHEPAMYRQANAYLCLLCGI